MDTTAEFKKTSIDFDRIAKECLNQYASLGKGGAKPTRRADGKYEWTVLAGVVLVIVCEEEEKVDYVCIALTTGVKALPFQKLSTGIGDLLHDSHAEVLARRSARHWLLQRLLREQKQEDEEVQQDSHIRIQNGQQSVLLDSLPHIFIRTNDEHQPPSRLKDTVSLHLYCSTLPCGDVSSNLIVQNQLEEQSNIEESPRNANYNPGSEFEDFTILRGRQFSSSQQVHIRTKPGRPQAEPSISMSCSDKIANWILVGFQGTLLYGLIGKVNFASFVIGDQAIRMPMRSKTLEEQERLIEKVSKHAISIIERKCGSPKENQSIMPKICFTNRTFLHSRESVQMDLLLHNPNACVSGPSDDQDLVPCATSLVWILGYKPHGIVEGHRQGASIRRPQGEPLKKSSRSILCKFDWFSTFRIAKQQLSLLTLDDDEKRTYHDMKNGNLDTSICQYRKAKEQIRGTSELEKGDQLRFQMDLIHSFLREHQPGYIDNSQSSTGKPLSIQKSAPLYGWLVSGPSDEKFDKNGHVKITE